MDPINVVLETHCVHISMPYEVGQLFVNLSKKMLAYVDDIMDATTHFDTQYEVKVYTEEHNMLGANFLNLNDTNVFSLEKVRVDTAGRQYLGRTKFYENELQQVIEHYGLEPFEIGNLEQCTWIDSDYYQRIRNNVKERKRIRAREVDSFNAMALRLRLS